MRREVLDSMKASGYDEFLSACEDLRNCKYVIAENKIAALLKAIADNKQLYSMFGAALYGFDYKTEFADCVSGNGFSVPVNAETAVALVFRILLDIDSGKMPLKNFLEAYFFSESINESFSRFLLEVIVPFETYCKAMFAQSAGGAPGASEAENKMAETYDNVNGKFKNNIRLDAINCVAALMEIGESLIGDVIDREEYMACLSGLMRSIKSRDNENIISSFLGVKYAVAYFFKSSANVYEIYKKLEYDIKHFAD